jgi:hypothetical protein
MGGRASRRVPWVEDANDEDSAYRVRLYYDNKIGWSPARVVAQDVIDNNMSITFRHAPGNGKGYYFIEVTSTQGGNKGLMAWTATVWLE